MKRSTLFSAALAAAAIVQPVAPGQAQTVINYASSGDAAFDAWRVDFTRRAIEAGRNPQVVERLLSGIRPQTRIVELDQAQPEFVAPVWDYIGRAVSSQRIQAGSQLRGQYADFFTDIERRYGVDADIIAAIWGVETNFGAAPLTFSAPEAIATLAAEGRRRAQFETYLVALIQMVEQGLAGPEQLRSSWAGALGQPQFMPDAYLAYAVDYDNDGKRDIWSNTGDALASIGNYLAQKGWRRGEPVYDEVLLPNDFDYAAANGTKSPVSQWVYTGVRSASGFDYSPAVQAMPAELYLPAGADGPAFLLFQNFDVIRAYNASNKYALSVSLLARALEGAPGLARPWPTAQGALTKDQMIDLQTRLMRAGFNPGVIDGMLGDNTRRAIREFQLANNLRADGYPSMAFYQRLTGEDARQDRIEDHRNAPRLRTKTSIAETQRLLIRLGRLKGRADGVVGSQTRRAIQGFERSLGVEPTGEATTFILREARQAVAKLPKRSSRRRR